MKHLGLTCILIFAYSISFAQYFRIDSIPNERIVLDKAWKWHLGDNYAWADSKFDDSNWEAIDPVQDITSLTELPSKGIGWLRIHLRVAPSVRGQTLALYVRQAGATEIFLNGQLVRVSGSINTQKQVQTGTLNHYSQLVRFGADSLQTIAVRYALSTKRLPTRALPFFRITVLRPAAAEVSRIKTELFFNLELILFGIFLALGVLQLLLYTPMHEQRATLYFGLFLVTQSFVHLIDAVVTRNESLTTALAIGEVALFEDLAFITFIICVCLSSFFYLIGTYAYFRQSKRMLFLLTAIVTFASIPGGLSFRSSYWFTSVAVFGTIIPLSTFCALALWR